jgi:hypothetical protein
MGVCVRFILLFPEVKVLVRAFIGPTIPNLKIEPSQLYILREVFDLHQVTAIRGSGFMKKEMFFFFGLGDRFGPLLSVILVASLLSLLHILYARGSAILFKPYALRSSFAYEKRVSQPLYSSSSSRPKWS